MQHRRRAHAGANVGGTGRQISKPWIKCEVQFAFQRRVDFVYEFERLFQLESRTNRLHPQMIFFVDHDAERLPPVHHHGAPSALGGMLTADQVPLHEHLLVQCGKILQAFGKRVLHFRKCFDLRPDLLQD